MSTVFGGELRLEFWRTCMTRSGAESCRSLRNREDLPNWCSNRVDLATSLPTIRGQC
jgi:hypothetical protein